MKLWIDTNIILDVLMHRVPHYNESALIWKLCETKQCEGYISTLSFANLVYVMRKHLSPKQIEEVLFTLPLIFELKDLHEADLLNASKLQWEDFEDALQSVMALQSGADYLITRNVADFSDSKIEPMTPKHFLNAFYS